LLVGRSTFFVKHLIILKFKPIRSRAGPIDIFYKSIFFPNKSKGII